MESVERTDLWNVSNAEYHIHESVSHSRLEIFRSSPIEYEARFVTGTMAQPEPTPQLALGTALHAQILEPDLWNDLICIEPKCDRRTTEGKAAYAEFKANSNGKTVISQEQDAAVVKMAKSAIAHPEVQKIMENCWKREQAIRWSDHPVGIPVRCKCDIICSGPLIADFKTAHDVSPEGFAKACANYGYHRQGAMYIDIARAVLGHNYRFVHIAVQNHEPWETAAYYLDNQDIELGRLQNNRDLAKLKECYETGEWRGPQNTGIMKLKLPRWAFFVD